MKSENGFKKIKNNKTKNKDFKKIPPFVCDVWQYIIPRK